MPVTRVADDCSSYRMMMQTQAQKLQKAELNRQAACAAAGSPACAEANNAYQSESNLYRSLQTRYQQCQQHLASGWPFVRYGFRGYGVHQWNNPLRFDWSFSEQVW